MPVIHHARFKANELQHQSLPAPSNHRNINSTDCIRPLPGIYLDSTQAGKQDGEIHDVNGLKELRCEATEKVAL